MKRIISTALVMALLLGIFGICASAKEPGLTLTGSDCAILLPDGSSDTETYAAKVLSRYLSGIFGVDIPVCASASAEKIIRIDTVNDGENGSYTITASEDGISILGVGTRGPIYGVYGFLENHCGCRWYTKDDIFVPSADALVFPIGELENYTPFFEVTDTDFISPRDTEYSLAHGISGSIYRSFTAEQGGSVDYISEFCHTLATQFCARDKYFSDHPEYFALRKDGRSPNQLCLTNPDVLQIVTDEVLALLKRKHDPSQSVQIVSLTQDDNSDYCLCDNCKAIDKENGSQSGTILTFVNAVARAVKKAGYDNVAIDTFAYQYSRKAPTKVVPDDNVIVRICSIECCFGHTLDDPTCKENAKFMRDLQAWEKICNRIHIWNYTGNYAFCVCIFPDFHVLQRDLQIFYENGAKGIYEEGFFQMDRYDGEFGELRSYLLAKLMQNPYMDYEAAMSDFLSRYYGSGWESVREFLSIVCSRAASRTVTSTITQWPEDALPGITNAEVRRCDALWELAKAQASPVELDRLERSEICWRFWKSNHYKSEFSLLHPIRERMQAKITLYNDLKDKGIVRLGGQVYRELTDNMTMVLLRPAGKWCARFEDIIWINLRPLAGLLYKIFLR